MCVLHLDKDLLSGSLSSFRRPAGRSIASMTEYWVSQPKHWCEYCRCWIQNNPGSILHHEQGTRHKEQVELKLAQIRKSEREKVKIKEVGLDVQWQTWRSYSMSHNRHYSRILLLVSFVRSFVFFFKRRVISGIRLAESSYGTRQDRETCPGAVPPRFRRTASQ